MFTTLHTNITLISSTYHSSELDSLSEDGISDDDLDSDGDTFDEATMHEESRGGAAEDDIKSILSSDFDSRDLDVMKRKPEQEPMSVPQHQQPLNRSKLDWTADKRFATLEATPDVNADPFVYFEGQQSSTPMISNSSMLVQVAHDDDHIKSEFENGKHLEVIMQADDEISLNDNGEYEVQYKDRKKATIADILERDPDSQHSSKSFLLELGMQKNVSALSFQSMKLSSRTRRRGGRRNRMQNETWNHEPDARDKSDAIPNQPLPPSEIPSHLHSRQSFRGTEIIAHSNAPRTKSYFSRISKVSELSTPTMEEKKSLNRPRSRSNSFESSWDSTIDLSAKHPRLAKQASQNSRGDGAESVDTKSKDLTSQDNPTFRAGNQMEGAALDIPPPPPARYASIKYLPPDAEGRPERQLSEDSAVSAHSVKQCNRETLERLNDLMNATIGLRSPGLANGKSRGKSKRLSLGRRRDSMKRLQEKLSQKTSRC